MRVVDHDLRSRGLGDLDDPWEWRDVPGHAEDAVSHDEHAMLAIGGEVHGLGQCGHVRVRIGQDAGS